METHSNRLTALTESDRAVASERLRSYTRTALIYTGIICIALALLTINTTRRSGTESLFFIVPTFLVFIFFAWHFAWRQVVRMRHDIHSGMKELLVGDVTWLDRQKNIYGDTVTHMKIAGRRVTSRDQSMVFMQKSDSVELGILQTSGVVLSARLYTCPDESVLPDLLSNESGIFR